MRDPAPNPPPQVRSAGLLHQFVAFGGPGAVVDVAGGGKAVVPELHGDFSLNVANTLSADVMLQQGCVLRLPRASACLRWSTRGDVLSALLLICLAGWRG